MKAIDHDGKSQTSFAGHQYPEPEHQAIPEVAMPTHDQIASLAHQLWTERGSPSESADDDWFEAERRLLRLVEEKSQVSALHSNAGSLRS